MRWTAVAVVSVLLTIAAVFAGQRIHRAHLSFAHGSAVSAISGQVMPGLRKYYASQGHYPPTLAELQLDLSVADGATEASLGFVRYSSDGESFTYAEVGPDKWHRRVWWCHGASQCGAADLR